jgi:co-chaperonin GroES (HSP10)
VLRVLADKVAVRHRKGESLVGRIIVPNIKNDPTNQRFVRADVIAQGPKCKQAGAKVAIVSEFFGGDPVRVDDEQVFIGRERDVFAYEDSIGRMTPTTDRVLMALLEDDLKAGDLWLPEKENVRRQQYRAQVLDVGPDVRDVAIGSTVMVPRHLALKANIDGKPYLLIGWRELLAELSQS